MTKFVALIMFSSGGLHQSMHRRRPQDGEARIKARDAPHCTSGTRARERFLHTPGASSS